MQGMECAVLGCVLLRLHSFLSTGDPGGAMQGWLCTFLTPQFFVYR